MTGALLFGLGIGVGAALIGTILFLLFPRKRQPVTYEKEHRFPLTFEPEEAVVTETTKIVKEVSDEIHHQLDPDTRDKRRTYVERRARLERFKREKGMRSDRSD